MLLKGARDMEGKVEDDVKAIKALEHTYKRPGTKPRKEWQEGCNEKLTSRLQRREEALRKKKGEVELAGVEMRPFPKRMSGVVRWGCS